jgi:CIC family chloride channel protein
MKVDWQILVFYFISVMVGIFTGFFGAIFQMAIHWTSSFKFDVGHFFSYIGLPGWLGTSVYGAVCVLAATCMVYYFAPEASGSGVQEIEGALLGKRPVFWRRLIPVKFFGGLFSLSAGMVLGREGPTIQMGGNFGEMLGEWFQITREKRDILLGAGAACGLATAFNAPLAGIVFILEEMREHFKFSFLSIGSVAFACISATIVLRLMLGQAAEIPMKVFDHPDLFTLWLFLVFGVFIGFVGLLFNVVLVTVLDTVVMIRHRMRFVYALTVGFLVGLLSYFLPSVVGGGYKLIAQAMTINLPTYLLLFLVFARFITTIVCYSTGVPGGIFAPILAIGTVSGLAFGNIALTMPGLEHLDISAGMFAVAGMGALFAASIRAPMTGIILIVEMTQNYRLILPSMITCLMATTVAQLANNAPIYEQLLERTLRNKAVGST